MTQLLQAERDKYERMWAIPEYRENSPGESAVDAFLQSVSWTHGDSVLDLGCGTGRASLRLANAGLRPTLVDITPAALDAHVRDSGLPFVEASLWDLPATLEPTDWLFCIDVLEHLPSDLVDMALREMVARTLKGGMFDIALCHDSWGERIGECLHLTVKDHLWWSKKIAPLWSVQYDAVVSNRGSKSRWILGQPRVT